MPNILTQNIDKDIKRWLGVPIFLFVMYLMFVLAINIGGALQPAFEGGLAIFIHGIQWIAQLLLPLNGCFPCTRCRWYQYCSAISAKSG